LILLAKMSFNVVFRNQVGVDREVLRGGALYQGTTSEAAEKSRVLLNLRSLWFIFLVSAEDLGRFY